MRLVKRVGVGLVLLGSRYQVLSIRYQVLSIRYGGEN